MEVARDKRLAGIVGTLAMLAALVPSLAGCVDVPADAGGTVLLEGLAAAYDLECSDAFWEPGRACERCHDKGTLAAKTVESAALFDSEGKIANPHDLPDNGRHQRVFAECTVCHPTHAASVQIAKGVCLTCHHQDVFACGTCHELRA